MVSHIQPGDRIGDWVVRGELGRGGMAIVLLVEHAESGEERALKIMLPAGRTEDLARRFQRVLSELVASRPAEEGSPAGRYTAATRPTASAGPGHAG